jgi:2-aminoadipate transaminase
MNLTESATPWRLSVRAEAMNPSVIREILKVTERPGILNFAGGLPSPETFPVAAMRAACAAVLAEGSSTAKPALQYAASEGLPELRAWVAAEMAKQGARVDPAQVLITTGSQQGLDLISKVLIDEGAPVLVETPTYLGALQAFAPMQPRIESVASDDEGVLPDALHDRLTSGDERPRFIYLLPNFQNPTGRTMPAARREAVLAVCREHGLPIIEDNPYGELWFDQPPPAPLLARWPEGVIYLGSFSKILAPGLRLGYVIAPPAIYPKLLQAKQAADLHTPGFNQRVVVEVLKDGFLDRHVPTIRALYKTQRDAMLAALAREMAGLDVTWTRPVGGMFAWLRLPEGVDAQALLPAAVDAGMAFVPGAPFFAAAPDTRTLRLSVVTSTPDEIDRGMAALARVLRQQMARGAVMSAPRPAPGPEPPRPLRCARATR